MFTLRRLFILTSIGFIVFVLTVIFVVSEMFDSDDHVEYFTSVEEVNFTNAKILAEKSLTLFTIVNQQDYVSKRDTFKSVMDEKVWMQYFPSGAPSVAPRNIKGELVDVRGHIEGRNEFVFRVRAIITYQNNMDMTYLVKIEDGLITQISVL